MPDMITVRGWMSENERLALRRLAFGRAVLEVGSYEGLSTAQLAATAKSVVAVDTFDGRGTVHYGRDTYAAFCETLRRCGTADRVTPLIGLSATVLARLSPDAFDLIFIDASHDYDNVHQDATLALPLLRHGGLLAFHDCDERHPGVARTVAELVAGGARQVERYDSLAVLSFVPPAPPPEVRVAVVQPNRGDNWAHIGSTLACTQYATRQGVPIVFFNRGTSVLPRTFNALFADALNARDTDGVTHFAMLHDDVIPGPGWVDVFLAEMARLDCDLISAVVPLKSQKGLTSTGLDTPGDPWSVRRLCMAEIHELPETFTAADVPYRADEQQLLLNTGCWLMRLAEPWVEGLCFRQTDRVAYDVVRGKYCEQSISEDWDFSRQVYTRGGRLAATRKVAVVHDRPEFHNRHPWGAWATDLAYVEYRKERSLDEAHPSRNCAT